MPECYETFRASGVRAAEKHGAKRLSRKPL
jgi:hypothetical protein